MSVKLPQLILKLMWWNFALKLSACQNVYCLTDKLFKQKKVCIFRIVEINDLKKKKNFSCHQQIFLEKKIHLENWLLSAVCE